MLGRTHLLIGILLAALYTQYVEVSSLFLFFLFTSLGALFPDIDQKNSLLGRYIPFFSTHFKHRGFFHSPLLLILLLLILLPFNNSILQGFALGFSSHLLADMVSKEGLQILFWKIKGPIKVGSWQEHVLVLLLLLGVFIL